MSGLRKGEEGGARKAECTTEEREMKASGGASKGRKGRGER